MNSQRNAMAMFLAAAALSYAMVGTPATAASKARLNVAGPKSDQAAINAQLAHLNRSVIAGHAQVLGSLWSDDGTYTDDDGNMFSGRADIEKHFAKLFAGSGGYAVQISPQNVRFLGKTTAIADGVVKRPSVDDTLDTRFSIVFTKSNGQWLIASATETPVAAPPASADDLSQLGWMIGEWQVENGGTKVTVNSEWTNNKKFILSRYHIQRPNQAPEVETQLIGWDPRGRQIVSWNFDNMGGFGQGVWTKRNNEWLVQASGTTFDGKRTRAINTICQVDPTTFTWQSTNRSIDGSAVGDLDELKVRRSDAKPVSYLPRQ